MSAAGIFSAYDKMVAQRKHALGMGPDRHLAVLEFGDRAGRTDRGVRHVRLAIGRLDRTLAPSGSGACLSLMTCPRREAPADHRRSWPDRAARAQRPFGALDQRFARLDRLLLALGDDAEETAVAHDRDDAGHRLDRRLVDAVELRAVARRTHDAAMHHARQPHVLHIGDAAGHLARDVEARNRFADDLMSRRRAWARPSRSPRDAGRRSAASSP